MPKTKTSVEKRLINDHRAEENLPAILKLAIAQADYLPDLVIGNQIVPNRISGKEYILTPLAYQVYTVAIYAHDILWSLNDLSDAVESMPLTAAGEELRAKTKAQHQKMYEDNHEIFYTAREWFIDYYIDAYMGLMD